MKKVLLFTGLLGLMSCLIFIGCKKKETSQVDNETQSAVDNAVADQEYCGIVPTVNNIAITTKGAGTNGRSAMITCKDSLRFVSGDTVTFSPNPVFTLNIANPNCNPMPDGAVRIGTLSIRLTGKIKNPGSQMIIKMSGYKKGTTPVISYTCDSMIVTTVASSTLSTTFNIKLINGVCSTVNWTIHYNSDRTITHYPHGNPYGSDPMTESYGTANGVNRQGLSFTVNIPAASPIVKHKSCQYIEKGKLELTPQGFATRSIDFGNGACDDDATFTVNGNTISFKLK